MGKLKVDLTQATGNKKRIQGKMMYINTQINYSNDTEGLSAQEEMVIISEDFKTTRETIKTALTRDTNRIEQLAVEFLDIDKKAKSKEETSVGKHLKM